MKRNFIYRQLVLLSLVLAMNSIGKNETSSVCRGDHSGFGRG